MFIELSKARNIAFNEPVMIRRKDGSEWLARKTLQSATGTTFELAAFGVNQEPKFVEDVTHVDKLGKAIKITDPESLDNTVK